MFEIDKSHCVTTEQKLLYNIQESLKVFNIPVVSQEELNKMKNEVKTIPLSAEVQCKYCGGTHKNRQAMAACAKKHRKGSD